MSDGAIALTRHERIQRGQANRKAREELRNAVRFCMKESGVTPADINTAAKDMTQTAVNKVLKERNLEAMIDAQIKTAMGNLLPTNKVISETIKAMIEKEAVLLAQQIVSRDLSVSIATNGGKGDAKSYEDGGKFS